MKKAAVALAKTEGLQPNSEQLIAINNVIKSTEDLLSSHRKQYHARNFKEFLIGALKVIKIVAFIICTAIIVPLALALVGVAFAVVVAVIGAILALAIPALIISSPVILGAKLYEKSRTGTADIT
jgi:hypothetical protein